MSNATELPISIRRLKRLVMIGLAAVLATVLVVISLSSADA